MTEEEVAKVRELIKGIVAKFNGTITFEESQGKKRLAYPVEKNHQGYYELVEFDIEGSELANIERELKLTNEVMRHMVVKKDVKSKAGLLKVTRKPVEATEDKKESTDAKKEEAPVAAATPEATDKDSKLKLEDLDNKLDEILEGDIM